MAVCYYRVVIGVGNLQEESAVACWSDIHWGKQTPTYNPDIATDRLLNWERRLYRIAELQEGHKITELHMFLLGDMLDGSLVFPTQTHHQAITDPIKAARSLASVTAGCMARIASRCVPRVVLHKVGGNHGRVSKYHHEDTNWDVLFYELLEDELVNTDCVYFGEDDRVQGYRLNMATIRGHKFLLHHGDSIKMRNRLPWYGIENATKDWYISLGGFDKLVTGHFHRCTDTGITNDLGYTLSGTPVTDDDYTVTELKCLPVNRWPVWGVSDTRAQTWRYELDLL